MEGYMQHPATGTVERVEIRKIFYTLTFVFNCGCEVIPSRLDAPWSQKCDKHYAQVKEA